MFDCCRVPGLEGADWSVTYAKEGDTGNSGHIIVLRKGRVWRLDPWQNGRLLSVAELERYGLAISQFKYDPNCHLPDKSNILSKIRLQNSLASEY